ncbi:hypothetical protein C8Q72DRAFT_949832 [Fomitopsis betulina]|nr:hypothetical protein C8Q72DRAFT_949832 [Fomitopsis betulina]
MKDERRHSVGGSWRSVPNNTVQTPRASNRIDLQSLQQTNVGPRKSLGSQSEFSYEETSIAEQGSKSSILEQRELLVVLDSLPFVGSHNDSSALTTMSSITASGIGGTSDAVMSSVSPSGTAISQTSASTNQTDVSSSTSTHSTTSHIPSATSLHMPSGSSFSSTTSIASLSTASIPPSTASVSSSSTHVPLPVLPSSSSASASTSMSSRLSFSSSASTSANLQEGPTRPTSNSTFETSVDSTSPPSTTSSLVGVSTSTGLPPYSVNPVSPVPPVSILTNTSAPPAFSSNPGPASRSSRRPQITNTTEPRPTARLAPDAAKEHVGIIVGTVLGVLFVVVVAFGCWWMRRKGRRTAMDFNRVSDTLDGTGLIETVESILRDVDRQGSFRTNSTSSDESFGNLYNRVSLPASTFSPLVCEPVHSQTPEYEPVTLMHPSHDLLSPTPSQHPYTNRTSSLSPTSPEQPSPLSAASLTSLLNAAWPAVPPTILTTEPGGVPSGALHAETAVDILDSFTSQTEDTLRPAQTRAYRVSRILSALAND